MEMICLKKPEEIKSEIEKNKDWEEFIRLDREEERVEKEIEELIKEIKLQKKYLIKEIEEEPLTRYDDACCEIYSKEVSSRKEIIANLIVKECRLKIYHKRLKIKRTLQFKKCFDTNN